MIAGRSASRARRVPCLFMLVPSVIYGQVVGVVERPAPASAPPLEEEGGWGRYEAVADTHAECPICFESLCSAPTAVFASAGRRSCFHYFHAACARDLAAAGHAACPLCRAAFSACLPVPLAAEEPEAWFRVVDGNGDGMLNQREVLEALKAQFPVDHARLECDLPGLWPRWDPSGDGKIALAEFLGERGLLTFIREEFIAAEASGGRGLCPDIRRDKEGWFAWVDEDGSGELSQGEVVRGLVKSFRLADSFEKNGELRSVVANVWFLFDHDGGGGVDRAEFLKPGDGLADTVIASFALP